MVFEVRESIYDGFRVIGCVLCHLLDLDIASDIDELVAAVAGIADDWQSTIEPVRGGYVKTTRGQCLCQHVDNYQNQLAD